MRLVKNYSASASDCEILVTNMCVYVRRRMYDCVTHCFGEKNSLAFNAQ